MAWPATPQTRRAYLVTLTPHGQTTQQQGRQRVDHAQHTLLAALDDQDQRTLTSLLAQALQPGPRLDA